MMFTFPFDRRLPRLPHLLTARALVRMLETDSRHCRRAAEGWRVRKRKCHWELLSYRPERRAVVHWRVAERNDRTQEESHRDLVVRIHAAAIGPGPELYDELTRSGIRAPELVAAPSSRIRVESLVTGRPLGLHELVAPELLDQAGALLARWHSLPTSLVLPLRRRSDLLRQAEQSIDAMRENEFPGVESLGQVMRALARDTTDRAGMSPLHGDAHPAQFLDDGSRLALLDWDRTARGEPAEDLANLWMHLVGAGTSTDSPQVAALLRGYAREGGLPTDEDLRWHRIAAGVRLLELPLRRPGIVPVAWSRRLVHEVLSLARAGALRP
jgi:hypothetical protein